jgi:hypothetical protein
MKIEAKLSEQDVGQVLDENAVLRATVADGTKKSPGYANTWKFRPAKLPRCKRMTAWAAGKKKWRLCRRMGQKG